MLYQIKVHDVLHDKHDRNTAELADCVKRYIGHTDDRIQDVRIAPGPENSPIFITVAAEKLTLASAKKIAKRAVRQFSKKVDGVDIDRTIRDDNIRMEAVDK